jgi:hypothetical protein
MTLANGLQLAADGLAAFTAVCTALGKLPFLPPRARNWFARRGVQIGSLAKEAELGAKLEKDAGK